MTKKQIKSPILLCLGLFMGMAGFSQSTVFSSNTVANYGSLDATQKANIP